MKLRVAAVGCFAAHAAAEHKPNTQFGYESEQGQAPKKNPCHEKASREECYACCTAGTQPSNQPAATGSFTAWNNFQQWDQNSWWPFGWATKRCKEMCDAMAFKGHMTFQTDSPTTGPTATTKSPTTASPTADIPALYDRLDELLRKEADLKQVDRELRAVCAPSCEIAGCGVSLADSIGCHCDDVCGKYGDCCSDYTEACPRSACEWEGTWYQGDNDGPMELDILLDENNDVSGTGDDEVGFFTLEGWATQMNIHLTKQYVDNGVGGASHALVYAGVSADGLNYSGHWTVPGRNEEGTFDITAPDSFLCRAQALCTVDACGEQSEQGDCWCDEGCASYGDCCLGFDFEAEC